MMKKKLFLFVISLIIGVIGGGKSYAYTVGDLTSDGWAQLTTVDGLQTAISNGSYFALVTGRGTNLMIKSMSYGNDANRLIYQSIEDPVIDKGFVWIIEYEDSKYYLKNANCETVYFGYTGSAPWDYTASSSYTTKTSAKSNLTITVADGKYTIATEGGGYLGPWGDSNFTKGERFAGNKAVANAENFIIYAISRTNYEAKQQAIINAATNSSGKDVTFLIKDANMDITPGLSPWTGGVSICGEARFGSYVSEKYHTANTNIYQTLTEIPNGKYSVSLQGTYRQDNSSTDKAILYVGDQTADLTNHSTIDLSSYTEGNDAAKVQQYLIGHPDTKATIDNVIVTDGTLTLGVKTDAANANNLWIVYDNFKLTYYGIDLSALQSAYETAKSNAQAAWNLRNTTYVNVTGSEKTALENALTTYATCEETQSAYETATSALNTAKDAFINAKANYDLLATEITKATALGVDASTYAATSTTTAATALTNTKNLKVAEYTYVTTTYPHSVSLGTWATDNAVERSGQHWDGKTGEETSKYCEQDDGWGKDSWSCSYTQDLNLPAGNYVFKVAGRTSAGNSTISLVVTNKSTSEGLGTVNDFPKGDTGLGINKAGATSFDSEDAAGFTNAGAGRGWEWRYVKFTLASDATVTISINGNGYEQYQWIGFCNPTVQTDNEASISLIAYNIALNDANTAINSTDYKNVTGSEKTELQELIDGDATLDKTNKTAIDAAKSSLETKTTAFTDAKDAYDAFVAAKATEYENNLPYASATKFAAIATAQAAADATSAADATTKTNAIISAYRKYVESNALAEGVDGAEAIVISDPNMDVTYNSETHKFGAWQVIGQTNGNIQLLSGESFTDGDGKHDYKYADIYKNDNNAGIQQTVNLEAGTYILTVTARAKNTAGAAFWVFAGDKKQNIERIGSSGGVFDRGWNDCTLEFEVPEKSGVNIGVQSGNGKDLWWSATRFRLMKIKEGANMKITDAKWATFVAPFDVTIPDGVTAYTITGVSGTSLVKEVVETTIPANKPVLLNSESEVNQTFYGKAVAGTPTNGLLTGVYVDNTPATVGTYVLEKHSTDVNFYKVEGAGIVINANRAYLTVPVSVKMFSLDEDEEPTAIEGIDIAAEEYDAIYTPTGVKVESLQKGLNIVVKGEKSYKIFVK